MIKKVISHVACLGILTGVFGCTSKTSEEGASSTEYEETSTVEASDSEAGGESGIAGGEVTEESVTPSESAISETSTADLPPEEGSVAASASATTEESTALTTDATSSDSAVTTDQSSVSTASESPMPSPLLAETSQETPSTVESATNIDFSNSSSTLTSDSQKASKSLGTVSSLKKMESVPLHRNGMILNTVYMARPGENLKSIAEKIYGSDKSSDLKKANSYLKSRAPKVGDKIYYQSPHRPQDDTKVVTYYEDIGIAPEVYVAKEGENLKTVSKKLLGFSGAWKEIWSSNSIESKENLSEGHELRYWRQSAGAETSPIVAPAASSAGDANVSSSTPVTSSGDMANNMPMAEVPAPSPSESLPPPPVEASTEIPPMATPPSGDMPPPPVMAEAAPPPPQENGGETPPPDETMGGDVVATEGAGDDSMGLAGIAAAGLLGAGLAGLIIARKKRKQKEAEQFLSENQVS